MNPVIPESGKICACYKENGCDSQEEWSERVSDDKVSRDRVIHGDISVWYSFHWRRMKSMFPSLIPKGPCVQSLGSWALEAL